MEQFNQIGKTIKLNQDQNEPSEKPQKERKWLRVNYKKILILLFATAVIFYSFLAWKMTRTSNPLVANPKFILKSIFTWNPAELASNVFNKWDTLYIKNDQIVPATNFLEIKKQLEEVVKNEIYFAGFSNSIAIDDSGSTIFNEGTFIMKKGQEFAAYDYYIYKNETKAAKSFELDHKAGLVIYRQPQNVSADSVEEYKTFSAAALKALDSINFEELKKKGTERISLGRIMNMNIIQTSDGSLKPIETITFDDSGNITEGSKEKAIAKEDQDGKTGGGELLVETDLSVLDFDNDNLSNAEELIYGTRLHSPDSDQDGLNDYDEVNKYHTYPNMADSDYDGYLDGEEVGGGYNPMGEGTAQDRTDDSEEKCCYSRGRYFSSFSSIVVHYKAGAFSILGRPGGRATFGAVIYNMGKEDDIFDITVTTECYSMTRISDHESYPDDRFRDCPDTDQEEWSIEYPESIELGSGHREVIQVVVDIPESARPDDTDFYREEQIHINVKARRGYDEYGEGEDFYVDVYNDFSGISDEPEKMNDSDRDNIPDFWENKLDLEADNPDTDGDGFFDGVEVINLENPEDADNDGIMDAKDPDNMNPPDSDQDGVPDYTEDILGLDKDNADSDNDNLNDGLEINGYRLSDPVFDSDMDGKVDALEPGSEAYECSCYYEQMY